VRFDAHEFGDTGAARGLAALVKAALALHHEVLPPRGEHGAWQYWLRNRADGPRCASIFATSITGAWGEALLEEAASPATPTSAIESYEQLFVLAAPSSADLLENVAELERLASNSTQSLAALAHQWFDKQPSTRQAITLAIVAESPSHLCAALAQAR